MTDDCPICAKHRGQGPLTGELIARLDGFWIYHAPPGEDGSAPLGYLLIESDRHAPRLSLSCRSSSAQLNAAATARTQQTSPHPRRRQTRSLAPQASQQTEDPTSSQGRLPSDIDRRPAIVPHAACALLRRR
jgi:hypothetical protein